LKNMQGAGQLNTVQGAECKVRSRLIRSGSRGRGVFEIRDSAPCTLHAVWMALCTLLLLGCPSAAADHAKLGDQAVGEGDFNVAVAEYRAGVQASPRPDLLAKLGSAALRLKNYREAAEAYRRLGETDPSRAGEAATGLERVARAAALANDHLAGREALLGLQAIAPDRPAGRIALSLAMSGRFDPGDALPLLPYALAGARSDATTDSLLHLYGDALRETTACEEAVGIYQTLLRRSGGIASAAASGLAECALRLGLDAEALNQPEIAERWFRSALQADSLTDLGRQALMGLGYARLSQGDTLSAALAYRTAVERWGAADSLGQIASQQLEALSGGLLPLDSTLNRN
jgi:tetratricopeptide (TPR) repeat protein